MPTTVEVAAGSLRTALRRVRHARATHAGRPVLTAVLVESDGAVVRLVASDNYRLAIANVAVLSQEGEAFGPFLVSPADLPPLEAFLPESDTLTLTFTPGAEIEPGRFAPSDLTVGKPGGSLALRSAPGAFPDYARIVIAATTAPSFDPPVSFQVDLRWLKAVGGPVDLRSRRWERRMTVTVRGPERAVEVADEDGFREFIMPLRTSH